MPFEKFTPKRREELLRTLSTRVPPDFSQKYQHDGFAATQEAKRRILRRLARGESYADAYAITLRELFPSEFEGK